VLKLLERLEVQMISDVKRKIQKEVTLALAERSRDENMLPTDLWKRMVGARSLFLPEFRFCNLNIYLCVSAILCFFFLPPFSTNLILLTLMCAFV